MATDYRFYEGWQFQRLDPLHIEVYQLSFCVHCHRALAKNSRIFVEPNCEAPLAAGLVEADAPELRGRQPVAGSMDFCDECLDGD